MDDNAHVRSSSLRMPRVRKPPMPSSGIWEPLVPNVIRDVRKHASECVVARTDASVDGECVGIGVALYPLYKKKPFFTDSQSLQCRSERPSSTLLELLAVYHALVLAHDFGFSSIHLITDSRSVERMIAGLSKGRRRDIREVLGLMRGPALTFDTISVQWVPRAHNHVADGLARGARMEEQRSMTA